MMDDGVTENELLSIAYARIALGEQRKTNAGWNGEMHDGGGAAIIDEATAFIAGLNRQLPTTWNAFVNEQKAKEKIERKQYERLKKKFG